MNKFPVPFNDLNRIHKPIYKKVTKEFDNLVNKNSFILGEYVEKFENNFSKYTNSKFSISCANGTDAIELVLRALDIGEGDEVILPANTFIATSLAVSRAGATPSFVDNDSNYLIDVNKIEKSITKNTKAIIGVNLYGQIAKNKEISKIAKKNKLYFIEDSAQAHGALQDNKSPGHFSLASTYSFYPGKNLGAWGDGGCITTNNSKLANKILYLRNWGSKKKYIHNELGINSRLDPIQAVVLNEKLNFIEDWNKERNEIANYYLNNLDRSFSLPKTYQKNYHVWHLFVVGSSKRDLIIKKGNENNIEFGIHYPRPIHRQKAYKHHRQYNSRINNADKFSKLIFSLPIFPKITEKEKSKVVNFLNSFA